MSPYAMHTASPATPSSSQKGNTVQPSSTQAHAEVANEPLPVVSRAQRGWGA
jgi:hypothetical protein